MLNLYAKDGNASEEAKKVISRFNNAIGNETLQLMSPNATSQLIISITKQHNTIAIRRRLEKLSGGSSVNIATTADQSANFIDTIFSFSSAIIIVICLFISSVLYYMCILNIKIYLILLILSLIVLVIILCKLW